MTRGSCPYYLTRGLPDAQLGECTYGCRDEPVCITSEPEGGWREPDPGLRGVHLEVRALLRANGCKTTADAHDLASAYFNRPVELFGPNAIGATEAVEFIEALRMATTERHEETP